MIGVTDHALLKWMERVYGLDLDALRQHILDQPGIYDAIRMKAKRYSIGGFTYVFEDEKVITVTEANSPSAASYKSRAWKGKTMRLKVHTKGGGRPIEHDDYEELASDSGRA